MDKDQKLQDFIARVSVTPIPENELDRARLFAFELALGVNEHLWEITDPVNKPIGREYVEQRWRSQQLPYPSYQLMRELEYFAVHDNKFHVAKRSFDLLNEHAYGHVFISYKREYSSAFALLLLHRLKDARINAFLDMSMNGGEDWEKRIESEIVSSTHFVILLAPHSLESHWVVKELDKAVQDADRIIIPVCHSGFAIEDVEGTDIEESLKQSLQRSQAIPVPRETARDYNSAVVELLNVFGFTP